MGRPRSPHPSIEAVHFRLVRKWGRAPIHLCITCFKPAQQWAYLHTAGTNTKFECGSPYSYDEEDYAPMCRSCHVKLDEIGFLRTDPSAAGTKGAAAQQGKRSEGQIASAVAHGQAMAGVRRRCNECPMESHPVGIGKHQKASGHEGWAEL